LGESFLLQLKRKGKEKSDAYRIVESCFNDLLRGRYRTIQKKLEIEDLSLPLHELSLLSMRPARLFIYEPISYIQPDLQIEKIDGGWTLTFFEEKVEIRKEYLDLEEEALREFKTRAKWVCRSLQRRKSMLKAIGRILVCKQAAYLNQKGPLVPFTVRELAEKLEIHESTLSRALAGKYAATPLGIIPLRSLLTTAPETESARSVLEKLIAQEDKKRPLTDDQLAEALQKEGFVVARRTVAKYRTQLNISSAAKRKVLWRDRGGGK
jgi:RNA polymerase sigma-54 factor